MADNNMDDWEEVSLESETDDWEEITDEPEADINPRISSSMGRADVALAEDALGSKTAQDVVQNVKKGVKGMTETGLSKIGRLETDDIKNISGNLDRYKSIKSEPGKLPKEMAELADTLGAKAKSSTKDMDLMLDADNAGMKREKFLEEIKGKVSDSRMEPTTKRVKQAKDADKVLKKADRDITRLETKNEKKVADLQTKLDEKLSLKKEYTENVNKLVDDEIMRDNERQSLDKMLDDLKKQKRTKELEILEYKKAGGSRDAILDIQEEIKKLDIESDKLIVQKRKLNENLKNLKNTEKLEKVKNRKLANKYAEEAKEVQEELKNVTNQKKKDLKTLKKRLEAAKKNMDKFKLKGQGMTEANQKVYEGLERAIDYTTEMEGKDIKVAKEYVDKYYGGEGDDVRKAVREYITEKSPKAKGALDTASTAIQDRENLMKSLGYSDIEVREAGKTLSQPVMPKGEASSVLARAMVTEKGAEGIGATTKEQIEDILRRAGDPDKLTDLELNKISKLAKGDASVTDAYLAAKGLSPTAMKRILGDIGTKAQELGAQALGKVGDFAKSPVGKGLGKVAKGVGRTLPFVGAAFDYAEAGELGIENEAAKAAYVGVEQLNPLPVSTGQMYQMAKEAEETPEGKLKLAAIGAQMPGAKRAYEGLKDLLSENQVTKKEATPQDVSNFLRTKSNAQELVDDLNSTQIPSVQTYAQRLQDIKDNSDGSEYERKMSLLATEPAFRELMRRRVRRLKDGNGQEN